jgi:hypothetical protein
MENYLNSSFAPIFNLLKIWTVLDYFMYENRTIFNNCYKWIILLLFNFFMFRWWVSLFKLLFHFKFSRWSARGNALTCTIKYLLRKFGENITRNTHVSDDQSMKGKLTEGTHYVQAHRKLFKGKGGAKFQNRKTLFYIFFFFLSG